MTLLLRLLTIALLLAASGCSSGGGGNQSADSTQPSQAHGKDAKKGGAKQPSSDPQMVEVAANVQQQMGIRVVPVTPQRVAQTLSAPGQIMMNEQHTAHLGAIADGYVEQVLAATGDVVRRGQTLARIHSHTVHETVAALEQNMANVQRQTAAVSYAQQVRDRYAHLYAIQSASLQESQQAEQQLLQSKNDLMNSQAAAHMEREHLSELLQVPPATLTAGHLNDQELVPVRAVMDGTVIARQITPGMVVQAGMETYTVSDLHSVWMIAQVDQKNIAALRPHALATVHAQGFPNESFPGRVLVIGSTLDPATRTIPVRVLVPNPQQKLRPQMFATAEIEGPATRDAIFIPESALQDVNGVQVVFVQQDGTHFRAQVVKLGPLAGDEHEVTDGLKSGDHIVAGGSFVLKSEMLRGALSEE